MADGLLPETTWLDDAARRQAEAAAPTTEVAVIAAPVQPMPTFEDLLPATEFLGNPDDESHMVAPGASRSPVTYGRSVWDLRHFMMADARGRVSATYTETVLGKAWLFLEPVLSVAVYFIFFGIILDATRGLPETADFLSYLAVGKLSYATMRRAITSASGTLAGTTITLDVPRAVFPVSRVVKSFLQFRYELVVAVVFVFLRGQPLQFPNLLMVLPLFALMALFSFGAALLITRTVSALSDVRSALPHLFTLGLYSSGVIFPTEQYLLRFDNGEQWVKLYTLNPFYDFVKLFQWAIMGYEAPEMTWIVIAAIVWTVILAPFGFLWFVRGERRYSTAISEDQI